MGRTVEMGLDNNTIRHLGHSSFMMKLEGAVMVFDYCLPVSNPAAGVDPEPCEVDLRELPDEELYVFASHGHQDHFHPVIFDWRAHKPRVLYILAYDIPPAPVTATVMKPGQRKKVGRLEVQAYASTDQGLAYSIYHAGRHVYFSGDNAFWNWDGSLDDEVYHRTALADIDRQTPMDVAFQVCDPRLDGMGDGGIHIFARIFRPGLLVPIHGFGNYAFNTTVAKRLRTAGYDRPFWCIRRPGETYVIP